MTSFGGDSFKIVSSGQPVKHSARRENLVSEVLKEHLAENGPLMTSPQSLPPLPIPGRVLIKNTTADTVGKFGVLGIDGVEIDHDQNAEFFESGFLFTGVEPAVADHRGKFVVLSEPINPGGIGRGYLQGTFPAKVDIVTEGDKWCDVKDADTTELQSGGSGAAEILYAPTGTGTQWCIIRVGSQGRTVEVLRLESAATPGGTYIATIRTPPTADVPAGTNFEDEDLGGDGDTALVVNLKELGATTHELVDAANTDDRNCIGLYLYTNSDGAKVFVTDKIWLGCPPDDPPSDWV